MRAIALYPLLALAAFPAIARAGEDLAPRGRPPEIAPRVRVQPAISDGSAGIDAVLRSGRAARITFLAEDPDHDVLTYSLASPPAGATFEPQQGVLTWRPTRDQEGKHEVELEVSDGHLTATHTFTIIVRANQAPTEGGDAVTFKTVPTTHNAAEMLIGLATDPDRDEVTGEIRKGPPGLRVVVGSGSAALVWSPSSGDIGEHEIVVDVSDGELRTSVLRTIVVMPAWEAHDYRRWLLLGGGPSAFIAHGNGEAFLGGTVDITLVALREDGTTAYLCAHGMRDYDCHASHHRFYTQFEVLDSMRSGAESLFTYAAGYSASFEWRPARRHLIPHYGIDAGGLVRAGVGHRAQVHPYLGVHLWASHRLWVNAALGYRVAPAELLDLSGPTLALRAVLNPW
jgi:hypothetical protein